MFLPGIISAVVIDILTTHRKRQSFHFLLHSYLLGVTSYGFLMLVVWINNRIVMLFGKTPTWKITFLNSLLDSKVKINVSEVFYASLISIIIAIIVVVIVNNKTVYKIANALRISNKHGEDDVWDYYFSSTDIEWITIRDSENKLVYQGAVSAYSQKDDKRELILAQVQVYKDEIASELKLLYEKDFIYFSFDANSRLIIEHS